MSAPLFSPQQLRLLREQIRAFRELTGQDALRGPPASGRPPSGAAERMHETERRRASAQLLSRGDAEMLERMRLSDEALANRLMEGDAAHLAMTGGPPPPQDNSGAAGSASSRSPLHPDSGPLSQLALRVLSGDCACLSGAAPDTLGALHARLASALLAVDAALGDARGRPEGGGTPLLAGGADSDMEFIRVPRELLACPITCSTCVDPVIAADGHNYDRAAIEAWLRNHDTSPVTNLALPNKQLLPNRALRAMLLSAARARPEPAAA